MNNIVLPCDPHFCLESARKCCIYSVNVALEGLRFLFVTICMVLVFPIFKNFGRSMKLASPVPFEVVKMTNKEAVSFLLKSLDRKSTTQGSAADPLQKEAAAEAASDEAPSQSAPTPLNENQDPEAKETTEAPEAASKPEKSLGEIIMEMFKSMRVTDTDVTVHDSMICEEASRRKWREAVVLFLQNAFPKVDLNIDLELLADYFLTEQQNNKAAILYLIMLEGRPLVPKFYNNAALAYLRMEDAKSCYALASRSALIKPDNKQSYSLQGLALKKMKAYALACVAYSKVLQLDPKDEKGQLGYRICEALYHQTQAQPADSLTR